MKKALFSFTNLWATVITLIIFLLSVVLYVIIGSQVTSANDKRGDLVRYSSLYSSSFDTMQSELTRYAATKDTDHYTKYCSAYESFCEAEEMLKKIGLTDTEKSELKEVFDEHYDEYVKPVLNNALTLISESSDFDGAKSALLGEEYAAEAGYCSVCLSTLSETVYDRATSTISTLETRYRLVGLCVSVLAAVFSIAIIITSKRLRNLALRLEEEDNETPDEASAEALSEPPAESAEPDESNEPNEPIEPDEPAKSAEPDEPDEPDGEQTEADTNEAQSE